MADESEQQAVARLLRKALQPKSRMEHGPAVFENTRLKTEGLSSRLLDLPALQQAKDLKIQQLQDRLADPLFVERLLSQGIEIDPAVLEGVGAEVSQIPVTVEDEAGSGVLGATRRDRKTGQQSITLNPQEILTSGLRTAAKTSAGDSIEGINWALKDQATRTLRHELEHGFSGAFRKGRVTTSFERDQSLADIQRRALRDLVDTRSEEMTDLMMGEETDEGLVFMPDYASNEHIRVYIMSLRDELGKEIIDAKDLELIRKAPDLFSRDVHRLMKMIETSAPKRKPEEIVDIINSIAMRDEPADDGTRVA